jgi:hypothetical protein
MASPSFLRACALLASLCALAACSSKSSDVAASDTGVDTGDEDPQDAAPPECTAAVNKGPWVLAIDETSAKIRWESCVSNASGISYSKEGDSSITKAPSKVTVTKIDTTIEVPLLEDADWAGTYYMNEVALTGLTAGTCYSYSVDSDASIHARFCTARPSGTNFEFIGIGDTNPGLGVAPAMVQKAYAAKPDFTIHAGDVQYYSSGLETWTSWMASMAPMLRTGGFFPCVGNHESERDTEKHDYYDRFFGGAGFDGTNDYYRFESGGVWFFSLDTEEDDMPTSLQGKWLETQLLDAQSKPGFRFSIVFLHRPWATCGDQSDHPDERAAWTPIFEKTGVKMIVQGHMHGYERFELGSLTYITTAGGGGALGNVDANITRDICASRKASGNFFHTVLFEVTAGQIKGTVTDDHDAVRDTFTEVVP